MARRPRHLANLFASQQAIKVKMNAEQVYGLLHPARPTKMKKIP
jgi:hypothetical protein